MNLFGMGHHGQTRIHFGGLGSVGHEREHFRNSLQFGKLRESREKYSLVSVTFHPIQSSNVERQQIETLNLDPDASKLERRTDQKP